MIRPDLTVLIIPHFGTEYNNKRIKTGALYIA